MDIEMGMRAQSPGEGLGRPELPSSLANKNLQLSTQEHGSSETISSLGSICLQLSSASYKAHKAGSTPVGGLKTEELECVHRLAGLRPCAFSDRPQAPFSVSPCRKPSNPGNLTKQQSQN